MFIMESDNLKQEFEGLKSEVCKRKLDSKCEALLILSKDLDQCRQERDQFKLMAEQVQSRYQSIKRQLAGIGPRLSTLDGVDYSDMKHQSLAQLLCEMRDVNKSLQFEVDDLKQKLKDSHGDIKLLREQIARHRVGTTDEGMDTRHFPAYEREDLVQQLETIRNQCLQLERDLQQVVDEKEELVTERDVYRLKYDRLNKELHFILKGDERRVLDIDALIMENRYMQERVRQTEDEKSMAMATISKYKNILEKKKNKGILKLGQNRSGGVVVSQKQVHQMLEDSTCLTPTPQMMADLQSLSCALLESLNDKNLALSHQRKTNKILGARVSELEKKLKTLEVTGLWNVAEHAENLAKLRHECSDIRTQVEMSNGVADGAGGGSDVDACPGRGTGSVSAASDALSDGEGEVDEELPTPVHRSSAPENPCLLDLSELSQSTALTSAGDISSGNSSAISGSRRLYDIGESILDLPVSEDSSPVVSADQSPLHRASLSADDGVQYNSADNAGKFARSPGHSAIGNGGISGSENSRPTSNIQLHDAFNNDCSLLDLGEPVPCRPSSTVPNRDLLADIDDELSVSNPDCL